ncbi:MAG: hypothetical protein CSA62_13665 [Planctomycetota bacterium]|nr:MAG: hypothetical protein CSA62_13665 [Planctomycetota bacterium]
MSSSELALATTRRQVIWRGDARPRLGLMLPAADQIDFARAPSLWEQRWGGQLAECAKLGLAAAALPPFFPNAEQALQRLSNKARELGLLLAIPCKLEHLLNPNSVAALSRIASPHPGSFLLVPLSRNDDARVLEERFHTVQGSKGARRTPIAFSDRDPLGAGSSSLIAYGSSTLFLDGIELGSELPTQQLLASLLAGRPETHPGLCILREPSATQLHLQALAALGAGHALVLTEAAWQEATLAEPFSQPLRALQATLNELPKELPPPIDAALKVWLDAPGAQRNPGPESAAGAIELLHRAGFSADILHAQALDRRARSSALWVPCSAPISSETWTALWSLAYHGSSVMITGFSFDELARERMTRLFAGPGAGSAPIHEAPAWLQLRHGSGSFVFSKHQPELAPETTASQAFVARFARWAELPQSISEPNGMQRLLRLGPGLALHTRLEPAELRVWRS